MSRRRHLASRLALLGLAGWLAAGLGPAPARADALVTDCTEAGLRAALGVGGRITFACDGEIPITTSLPVAVNSLLDASGHRISLVSTGASRFFDVPPGVHFGLRNVMLSGGRSTAGGAIFNNRGFLSLEGCTFSNNVAVGPNGGEGLRGGDSDFQNGGSGRNGTAGAAAAGGAIFNFLGTTWVQRCLFVTNGATGGTGGAGGAGGNGRFRGGKGGRGGSGGRALGGAIFNSGLLLVSNTTFQFNGVTGGPGGAGGAAGEGSFSGWAGAGGAGGQAMGGAIYSTNQSVLSLDTSTLSLNTARGGDSASGGYETPASRSGHAGGSAFGGAIASHGSQTALNCTFFANRITGGNGGTGPASDLKGGRGGDGGIAAGGQIYAVWRAAYTNCTLYSGGAVGGSNGLGGAASFTGKNGNPGPSRGGNLANANGNFTLKNCLIADAFTGTNGYGVFTDAGYNLSTDRSMRLRGPGSMTNTPARLDVPRRNGGSTDTIALLDDSPAINAGDPDLAPAFDQRGVPRPYGSRGDIGAYEYGLTLLPPVIVTQPQSRVAQVGATVTFLVVASGDPPLSYQWRRNGSPITSATGPVLTLVNLQPSDFTSYDVTVANNSGNVTSSSATLTRINPVSLTQGPQAQTVAPGSTVVFNASASGDGPLTFQWRFRGVPIPGANLTTYSILQSREVDSGPYDVVVFNSFSSVTSAPALLTVGTNAPAIIVQPEGGTVDSGKTVVLTVVASGSQPLFFQWFRNGTEALEGATNTTLTFTNIQPAQGGSYTVTISNSIGVLTSDAAVLTVNAVPPTITAEPPELLQPCHGDPVSLSVVAQGTEPLTYQWFRDGVALPDGTNAALQFTALAAVAGTYHVEVRNELGSTTSADALVLITDAPRITGQPADIEVAAGQPVELRVTHCAAPGPFAYQWFWEGLEIPGATNAAYALPAVTYTNAGAYSVTVTNLFGSETSLPALLTVLVPPAQVTVQVQNDRDPNNPVQCTYTFAALPGVSYTGFYRYSVGDEWIFFESATRSDETAGPLTLTFNGEPNSPAPLFRIVGEPLP